MIKFGKLLLCGGLIFSLAGCGNKSEVDTKALDMLDTVIKKTSTIKAASYKADIQSVADGEDVKMDVKGEFVVGENPQFSLSLSTQSAGQKMDDMMAVYLVDKTTYINLLGSKMKSADEGSLDLDTFTKDDITSDAFKSSNLKKFMKKATLEDNTISIIFDAEKIGKEISKESSKDLPSALKGSAENMKFKSISMSFKYNKQKYLTGLTFKFDATVKTGEEKQDTKATIKFTLSDLDSLDTIVLPEDIDTYLDMDSGSNPLLGEDEAMNENF